MKKSIIYTSTLLLVFGAGTSFYYKNSVEAKEDKKVLVKIGDTREESDNSVNKIEQKNSNQAQSVNEVKTIQTKSEQTSEIKEPIEKVEQKPEMQNKIAKSIELKSSHSTGSKIKWSSFNEGMKMAKSSKKVMFIDFYTDWCTYCKKLDNETYSDAKVSKYLNEKFIPVKVNAESDEKVNFRGKVYTERELALAFGVQSYPFMFFMENEQNALGSLPGFLNAEKLYPIINYIGSNSYKTKTIEEFSKTFKS